MNKYKKPVRDDDYSIDDSVQGNNLVDEKFNKEPPAHGHGMERDPDEPTPYVRMMSKGGLVDSKNIAMMARKRKQSAGDVPNEHDEDMRAAARKDGLTHFSKGGAVGGSPEYNDEFDLSSTNEQNQSEPDEKRLDNEPMGDDWESDEFLADPYGDMTANAHSSFDPEMERSDRRGRLGRILNSVKRMHSKMGKDNY